MKIQNFNFSTFWNCYRVEPFIFDPHKMELWSKHTKKTFLFTEKHVSKRNRAIKYMLRKLQVATSRGTKLRTYFKGKKFMVYEFSNPENLVMLKLDMLRRSTVYNNI